MGNYRQDSINFSPRIFVAECWKGSHREYRCHVEDAHDQAVALVERVYIRTIGA